MCLEAVEWVWENSRATGAARHILVTIAILADGKGVCDTMSLKFISGCTKVTPRHLIRAIRFLVASGELSVQSIENKREKIYTVTHFANSAKINVTPRTNKTIYRGRRPKAEPMWARDKQDRELWNALNIGRGPRAS
jgi:hypothetical protein